MLALVLAVSLTFADSTQAYYSTMDTTALAAACEEPANREDDLLCRYRLYPLTQEARYVDDLPTTLEDASARELALLSGLWGYRAARAVLPVAIRHGLHADRLMRRARALDPDEPYVLLVDGQSLLFRPALAGRDRQAAAERFRRLHDVVTRHPHCGISTVEADLWYWYALREMDHADAAPLRARLLAQHPPPLYRRFLTDPP